MMKNQFRFCSLILLCVILANVVSSQNAGGDGNTPPAPQETTSTPVGGTGGNDPRQCGQKQQPPCNNTLPIFNWPIFNWPILRNVKEGVNQWGQSNN